MKTERDRWKTRIPRDGWKDEQGLVGLSFVHYGDAQEVRSVSMTKKKVEGPTHLQTTQMFTKDGERALHPVHQHHHPRGGGGGGGGGDAATEGETVEQIATAERTREGVRCGGAGISAVRASTTKKERQGHTQKKRSSGSRHSTKRKTHTHTHTTRKQQTSSKTKEKNGGRNGPEERGRATTTHANNKSNEETTPSQGKTHARLTASLWKRQGRFVGSKEGAGAGRTW